MRICIAAPGPHFSVEDVYRGWRKAFTKLGVKVVPFSMGDRLTFYERAVFEVERGKFKKALSWEDARELAVNGLYSTLYKSQPDILFIVSGFFIPPILMERARAHGTKVALLHTESPYQEAEQLGRARYADFNLLNDPVNLDRYKDMPATRYFPHAYDPDLHRPGDPVPEMKCDFSFVGTGYKSRIEFFEQMDFGDLDVLLAGNWSGLSEDSRLLKYLATEKDECLSNEQTACIYRSSKVGLNLYRKEAEVDDHAEGWAMGPREVEMAACGLFYLREPRGEGDEILSMLPTFDNAQQASDMIKWYVNHSRERERLAAAAYEAVKDRTFENNAREFLSWVEKSAG